MRRNYWSCPRACPLQHEKALQWTAHSWQLESSPCLCNYGKAQVGSKTQQSQKSNKWRKLIKKKSIQVGITTNGVGYSLSQSLCATLPDEFRFSIFFKAFSLKLFSSLISSVPPSLLSPSEFLTKKIRSKKLYNFQSLTYKFSFTHSHPCLRGCSTGLCPRGPPAIFSGMSKFPALFARLCGSPFTLPSVSTCNTQAQSPWWSASLHHQRGVCQSDFFPLFCPVHLESLSSPYKGEF